MFQICLHCACTAQWPGVRLASGHKLCMRGCLAENLLFVHDSMWVLRTMD